MIFLRYHRALPSDGFCRWGKKENDIILVDATKYLLETYIPLVSSKLRDWYRFVLGKNTHTHTHTHEQTHRKKFSSISHFFISFTKRVLPTDQIDLRFLVIELHMEGINMRYLGRVRQEMGKISKFNPLYSALMTVNLLT